jgi:signal transduction histidine kinase
MKLYIRFSLVILGLLILGMGFYSGAYYYFERQSQYSQMNSRVQESVRLAAAVCREGAITGNWAPSQVHFRMLQRDSAVRYAECVDDDKKILADAGGRSAGGPKVWVVSHSIRVGRRHYGIAKIGYDTGVLRRRIRVHLLETVWLIIQVGSVILLFGVGAAFLISRTLTRPVDALVLATKEISKGNLDYRLSDKGRQDELGVLSTRFNEMAQRLEELSRMKEQMVSSLTHDIKNPLASIKGVAEAMLAEDGDSLSPKQRKYMKSSLECSLRLWSYIDNMLDVMKLQAGKYPVQIEPMFLDSVVGSVLTDQKVKAKECGVSLTSKIPKDLPRVRADFELIHRVLDNIVSNALKFTPPKGRIVLSAERDGKFVVTEVCDSGAGIPKDKLDKIFEDFFQVDETKDEARESGTGLGLAICSRISRDHGGRLWAESEINKGTRFKFTLPVAPKNS